MATQGHPDQRAARATVRAARLRLITIASLVVAVSAWALCGLSYVVEWSVFTAGPARPRAAMAGSRPSQERDETHFMFGRGGLFLHSMLVYTGSFSAPNSDPNSRVLAWATVDNMFPTWPPWRFGWYAPGPVCGVRLWLLATLASVAPVACVALRRRRVIPGHCARCRYDLRGAVARDGAPIICPECGTAASQ